MKKCISIEEFIEKELEVLKMFRDDWKSNRLKDEEAYPEYLFYGDWLEQYNFFNESNKTRELDIN